MMQHFSPDSLSLLAASYPNHPVTLDHGFANHPLMEINALAELAERLPASAIEYCRSDLPIGVDPDGVVTNGLSASETIRTIAANQSWAVLKNIEQDEEYRAMLHRLLADIKLAVESKTGPMLTLQGYIFISSPGSVTPYHFDPEHNILLHLAGKKQMRVFPAGDRRFAAQTEHERYHTGGHRNLPWQDDWAAEGFTADLTPGRAVYVPVMAPHFVTVGEKPALSLSITWRSDWSYREAEAHAANNWLRARGQQPAMPPRWPNYARLKTFTWRAARKIGLVG